MPHPPRYITLDEFRAAIDKYEHDDYLTEHGDSPYSELLIASMVEVPYYSHTHFRQYANILKEYAATKGVDADYVASRIDRMYQDSVLQGDNTNFICNYIQAVLTDERTSAQMSVLPLLCGAGKSTAISLYIRRVLEDADHQGILIVTDRTDRMDEYIHPDAERDPELRQFLDDHHKQIVILKKSKELSEQIAKAATVPVVIMTTQRYFSMEKAEIKGLLRWGDNKHRPLILFDESPVLTKHIRVTRSLLNEIASMISDGIPYKEDELTEKQFCISHWEQIRAALQLAICRHEALQPHSEYISPYKFDRQELSAEDKRFLRFIREHKTHLRVGQESDEEADDKKKVTDYAAIIEGIFRLMTEQCYCYTGRGGNWYANSISAVVDNRDKITGLDAKVIILDGTGEINLDYNWQSDDIRSGRKYSRCMDNLTIHFVNTPGISRDAMNNEYHASHVIEAAAKYIRETHAETPIAVFTYKPAIKAAAKVFDSVEYFGNIKGKNTFRNYRCTAQIGLQRYSAEFYHAQTLYHHPELLTVIPAATADELFAWYESIKHSDAYQDIMDAFMLVDLEQNLFRSKIRMPDCIEPIDYYVFCSIDSYQSLIEKVRQRFGNGDRGAKIDVVSNVRIMKERIERERPLEDQGMEAQLRAWIEALPSETMFTTRKQTGKGKTARFICKETGYSNKQIENLRKRSRSFDADMTDMETEWAGYYIRR